MATVKAQKNQFLVGVILTTASVIPGMTAEWTDHRLADWLWRGFLGTGTVMLLLWALDIGARFPSWRSENSHVRGMAIAGGLQVAAGLLNLAIGAVYFGATFTVLGLATLLGPNASAPPSPARYQLPVDRFVE